MQAYLKNAIFRNPNRQLLVLGDLGLEIKISTNIFSEIYQFLGLPHIPVFNYAY